jgi:superfamily II DNA/RNA helicase
MSLIARTADVRVDPATSAAWSQSTLLFSDLQLSSAVLRGLSEGLARAEQPSPVQLAAIPLARLGVDLIAQAKSGTGKTLVFVVAALEALLASAAAAAPSPTPTALIVAPTRELALQIADVVRRVGAFVPSLACVTVLGGVPIAGDVAALAQPCSVLVGTPGRLRDLVCKQRALDLAALRLFVLDEADRLLDHQFMPAIKDIVAALPADRQTLAFSATYSQASIERLSALMRDPQRVTLSGGSPTLIGVRQVRVRVRRSDSAAPVNAAGEFAARLDTLQRWLLAVPFQQCVVFCASYTRAQRVAQHATDAGWRAASIAGGLSQRERERTMNAFRNGAINVLVSTDLTARGIDVDLINLVVHFDAPSDVATYFHRVGRAGRFGTYGASLLLQLDPDDPAVSPLIKALAVQFRVDVGWLDDDTLLPADFLSGAAPTCETTATTAASATSSALTAPSARSRAASSASAKIDYGFDSSADGPGDGDVDDDDDDQRTVAMPSPESQPPTIAAAQAYPSPLQSAAASSAGSAGSQTTLPLPTRAAVGESCTVRWPDDGLWYDARIVGRAADDDNVRLVAFSDFAADQVHRAACEDIRKRDSPSVLHVVRGSDVQSCLSFARSKLLHGGVLHMASGDIKPGRTAIELGRSPVVVVGASFEQTAVLAKRARARGYQVFLHHFSDPEPFSLDDALVLDLDDEEEVEVEEEEVEEEEEEEDQPRVRRMRVDDCVPTSTFFLYPRGLKQLPVGF